MPLKHCIAASCRCGRLQVTLFSKRLPILLGVVEELLGLGGVFTIVEPAPRLADRSGTLGEEAKITRVAGKDAAHLPGISGPSQVRRGRPRAVETGQGAKEREKNRAYPQEKGGRAGSRRERGVILHSAGFRERERSGSAE